MASGLGYSSVHLFHRLAGKPLIPFRIDLRDVGAGMSEHNLTGFESRLAAYPCAD